jgi:hypothetical protein
VHDGREKGVPATPDHHGMSGKADLWPVTTLADGRKVLKFCGMGCCRTVHPKTARVIHPINATTTVGRIVDWWFWRAQGQ